MMVERKNGPVERWIAQVVVDGRKRRALSAEWANPLDEFKLRSSGCESSSAFTS